MKIPNAILPIDSSQILVLRDYAENVKRMLELIEAIDVAVPSEYVSEVIPIKYAQAADIAGALNSLSSGGGGTSVGGTGGTGGRRTGGTRTGTDRHDGRLPGTDHDPRDGSLSLGQWAHDPRRAPGPARSRSGCRTSSTGPRSTGEIQVLGQTKIISDERTNSLLIYASKDDMKTIKEIIAKLDVVLAQVLIEAAIIEVDLTDSRSLGFSYLQHPQNSGQWTGVGAINNGNMLQASSFTSGRGHERQSGRVGVQLLDVLWAGPGCGGDGGGGQQPARGFCSVRASRLRIMSRRACLWGPRSPTRPPATTGAGRTGDILRFSSCRSG